MSSIFYTKNSVEKVVISINLHYSDKKPCLNGKFKEGKVKKSGGGGRIVREGKMGRSHNFVVCWDCAWAAINLLKPASQLEASNRIKV